MDLFSGQLCGLERLLVLVAALGIETAIGYPDFLYRRIGHPVTWIGAALNRLEGALNRPGIRDTARYRFGLAALLIVVALAIIPAIALQNAVAGHIAGLLVLALVASTMFAARSLDRHVEDVADALDTPDEDERLQQARTAVSRIVGRETADLGEAAISRAAIESLSENFSDGVTAPAFWFALLGLPGAATYKAINTADSMIGHKNERFRAFGWAAARTDDIVNLPASRLTALLLIAAATIVPGAAAPQAAWTVWRDARRHRSPNAGWPEAAMAGALGLSLSGPRTYGGELIDDPAIGSGRRDATGSDIRRALALYRTAVVLGLVLISTAALAVALSGQV